MACLAYSLWNINVISTSAKIVDLAIPANIRIPDDGTDFSRYTLSPAVRRRR